ncbi:two-component system response regulator NarL [Candidatus Endoriftia persephone]|jgi:two-component system nitrate/nitrite response regulator NarL|uniref:Nitrate/nitrite response regulator protein NarL n=3 Tax=Gammaproteobacteria TaxID=1236 RepID=G2FFF6_9GAMM|nr:two-component system response regulator NarL [Candidatus Endoriftia persephone]EGV52161.1 nitrate/nitrite response regulator protein NarL [endosymbiont of Riftia pachyptila (vent Ph05)]EGW54534.1 nitrate/nitrite response regulator protein NarL [endosymbiont of Tevnia jerichonana (vent Tica)]USF88948.1 two-component system response regulator NarL [Candidatus Endoriftia persephone]
MNEQQTYSVLAIDDHPLFRKGVADLIDMEASLQLIGEAANGENGLRLAVELNPDLILLDINMKGMNGIETLKAIKQMELDSRILMLSVSDNEEDVVAALRLGADGYLLKDMEPEDILECLRSAVQGKVVISDRLTQLLARALREEAEAPKALAEVELTAREQEILGLISCGMSNRLISKELDIKEGTVKVHVKHLLKKLNLHSRVEAAVWALKNLEK